MSKLVLSVHNEQKKITVPNGLKTIIRKCCEKVLATENFGEPAEVYVTFVDNEEIRALNNEHRNKDSATDVLSFPMGEGGEYDENPDTGALLLGDIVISLERATEQAAEYGHSFEREVAFLTTHSMLHLLGYDHETGEEDEKIMQDKQRAVLEALGITR